MHKFKMKNGTEVVCETFMEGPSTNGSWINISKIEDDFTTWIECDSVESVDPNVNYIFGYEETEFMNKQYKKV